MLICSGAQPATSTTRYNQAGDTVLVAVVPFNQAQIWACLQQGLEAEVHKANKWLGFLCPSHQSQVIIAKLAGRLICRSWLSDKELSPARMGWRAEFPITFG
jgi:hypothetical protein